MGKITKDEILKAIEGGLIVSCQALPEEPLYRPEGSVMYLMARAAKEGGCCGIRANGVSDINSIKKETGLPVIGIIKARHQGYDAHITPTMEEIDSLMDSEADIAAFDCTDRPRGDGRTPVEFIKAVRAKYPASFLMADISTFQEGLDAAQAGVDLVGTTMSGYTGKSEDRPKPDLALVRDLSRAISVPVIAEGRYGTPELAARALKEGAFSVVVGSAITRPMEMTKGFVLAINQMKGDMKK